MQDYVGQVTHGQCGTRLYNIWKGIKARCLNTSNPNYNKYGAKGIFVCNEWLEFEPFYGWALENGYSDNLTIDRRDSKDGYTPQNCRWVTGSLNTSRMMDEHLAQGTGVFSKESKDKSKQSHRTLQGKPLALVAPDGVVMHFNSRGEAAEVLSELLNRKISSVKSQITQLFSGKAKTIGGYKLYEK